MEEQNTSDELIRLLHDKALALIQGDIEFFEQLLDNQFTYINSSGKAFNKSTYIEFFIKSKIVKWQTQDIDNINIRQFGNVAIVTCRILDQASLNNEAFEGYFRSTQIYTKQQNKWLYIAGQASLIVSE
jgi:hypothetical protein